MFKKEGKIDDENFVKLLIWKHNSGFSIHNGIWLAREDENDRESLAQHIVRNPFSVKKVTYNSASGTVIYQSKTTQYLYY